MSRVIENDYAQNAGVNVDAADKRKTYMLVKYLSIVLRPVYKQYVTIVPVSIFSMYYFH